MLMVQIFGSREEMIRKLRELMAEHAELQKRNRLLELRISRDMKKEKVTPTYATKDPEQMEQIYRQTLFAYKLRRDDVTERKERARVDTRSHEDKVRAMDNESARTFGELLDREKEVATGLVYAKTGRKLTEKAVDEITRRQASRREALARDRYQYAVLQQRLEEINTQLRSLETLGEGMTTMDYEALHIAHLSYKDKLEEREREVEKLRQRIAEVVNEIAHHKEKGTCLAENVEREERELDEHHERTVRVREDVNELHLILRDLRLAYDEKRRDAGLLMAQPVLHEMERTMKSMDALKSDIETIKRKIQRHGSAYRGKGERSEEEAASVMPA
ncbi:vicilin-like seed storage protein At2g18540 [Odontomachus brunneus]|uniref:vicilin-like seed storage protein At2g18540 n=1 Tax=Odontomachus brunneus TaxID=486640 RepID=UPI0013F29F40|nr:vicilin-like seed storage protein At2g18540 [Odontomachus brunneus]